MLYYSTEFWDTQNRGESLEVSVRSRWYVYREKSLKADWWAKGLTGMSGRFAGLGHGPERSGRVMNQGLGEIDQRGGNEERIQKVLGALSSGEEGQGQAWLEPFSSQWDIQLPPALDH